MGLGAGNDRSVIPTRGLEMTGDNVEQAKSPDAKRYDALAAAAWIPEMIDRIVREFDPVRIILFGSHGRGDAHRWSDIDLLVVFGEPVDNREKAIAIQRLLRPYLVSKDIVVTDVETLKRRGDFVGTVYRPALREGKELYRRA
jgi:uncharacterized protein